MKIGSRGYNLPGVTTREDKKYYFIKEELNMDGKQLHAEIVKLHHMIDDLYERAPLSKANSNLYQIIDEQYGKILTELIAKGVFQDE